MYPHPESIDDTLMDDTFGPTRRAPLLLLASLVAAHVSLKALFFSEGFLYNVALPFEAATNGLITPATLAGSIQLALLMILGAAVIGRFSWSQLGLRFDGQRLALTLLAVLTSLVFLVCLLLGASLSFDAASLRTTTAALLQSVVGSSLSEELFYRGFLLVQVHLLIRKSRPASSTSTSLVWSLLIVQSYFALNHVPAAMRAGLSLEVMLPWIIQTALVGAMLSVLFIQTRSLVLSVGAHALLNLSVPFLSSPVEPALVALLLVCGAMLAGPWLFERDLKGAPLPA